MRKTFIIIAVGIFIALFPVLALPPRMEAWILLVLGVAIIVFGFYERLVYREKNNLNTDTQDTFSESQKSLFEEAETDIQDENFEEEEMMVDNDFLDEETDNY